MKQLEERGQLWCQMAPVALQRSVTSEGDVAMQPEICKTDCVKGVRKVLQTPCSEATQMGH